MDNTYSSKPLTQVLLHVDYSSRRTTTATDTSSIQLDGTNFVNTTFLPTSSTLGVNGKHSTSWPRASIPGAELQNLRVLFVHNGLDGTVQFDTSAWR